jgi:hypothetical protein
MLLSKALYIDKCYGGSAGEYKSKTIARAEEEAEEQAEMSPLPKLVMHR